jgi:hypothetical protein
MVAVVATVLPAVAVADRCDSLAALPVRGSGSDHLGSPEPRRSYKVGRLVKAVCNAAPQRVMAP